MNLSNYHKTVSVIIQLLQDKNTWFETFEHEPVKTSEEAAQIRTGYSLEQGAKALILRVKETGGKHYFAQFVIPGDKKLDSKLVCSFLKAKNIRFATASEIQELTQGIEIGGIPPFGNLFGIPVYIDPSLVKHEKIIYNAGDRSFSIGMKTKDYVTIVKPTVTKLVLQ